MATSAIQGLLNPPTSSPILVTTPDKELRGPEMMRACHWNGTKSMALGEHPKPHLTDPNDAIVRITSTSLCGSDIHLYWNTLPAVGVLRKGDILGHEAVGIVEEVGDRVTKFRKGDRVVISCVIACGQCYYCQQKQFSACDTTNASGQQEMLMGHRCAGLLGFTRIAGGYSGVQAEFARVPFAEMNLLAVPASVPDDVAVLLADVAPTGWHAVEMGQVGPGSTVAVWGAGPIGLMTARLAKFRGAEQVAVIDSVPSRLEMAQQWAHADHVIDFKHENVLERLSAIFTHGPDICIDCVGFDMPKSLSHKIQTMLKLETDAMDTATEMVTAVRKGGTVSIVGLYAGLGNQFPIGAFMEKGLTMRGGVVMVQKYWEELRDWVAEGKLDLSGFITQRLPFEALPDGYRMFAERQPGVIKMLFKLPERPNATPGPA